MGRNPKLLIVEDDFDDQRLVMRALQRMDRCIDIEVLFDGEEAIERLCGTGPVPLPDLVLLDWKLPKQMGADVLRRVRSDSRCKDIAVVVFSSSDSPDDKAECEALGGSQYVVKPILYELFLAAVKSIVTEYCSGITTAPRSADPASIYKAGPAAVS